ncbi:MAG: hypothetical protein JRE23_14055 [Deltaproteobacteria bacterium]|nr:hypothetical protein [Deltaproteobacteria bacterium]
MNKNSLKKWCCITLGFGLPFIAILIVAWFHIRPDVLYNIGPIPLWITIGIGILFAICLPRYAKFLKRCTETKLEFWGRFFIDVILVILVLIGLSL